MSFAMMGSQFSQFAGHGSGDDFPNPFIDVSTLSVPATMRSALLWSEYIFSIFGEYRMAMERIISYFLTEVDIRGVSEDETDKWKEFFDNTLGVMSIVQMALRNRMCYGNDFESLVVPFKRFLGCSNKKCGAHFPLTEVYTNKGAFAFQFNMPDFVATCPICKTRGTWSLDDKPDDEEKKIKIKQWSPHEIELLHDPYTGDCDFLWRIPEDYKRKVREGNLFHLERVSQQVLEAITKNQMFRFNQDAVFHMKEPTLSGILNRGWGIPRIISNFRQIYYVQVLRRYNEAIALDYVIPFRLITPAIRQGSSAGGGMAMDPLMMYSGGDFRSQVMSMVRRRRRDPASWQVLPFPVNYQLLGGEANQLAPKDLLDQGLETLLNSAGTPVELYKGSLQLQTAPVALRLFEATWSHLVHDVNQLLRWVAKQVSQVMSWEIPEVSLKRVTISDDIQKQMTALQLFMSQQLSGRTAFAGIGQNWDAEQKRLAEEARIQAELQARTQEEMEQSGFAQQIAKGQPPGGGGGGAPPAGGVSAPPGGGGGAPPPQGGDPSMGSMQGPVTQYLASAGQNTPQTPNDMMSAADTMANQLLGLPEGTKDTELRKLKTSNPVLHSLVRSRMDAIRQQTRSAAGNAAMSGGQGGGGGQPPPAG